VRVTKREPGKGRCLRPVIGAAILCTILGGSAVAQTSGACTPACGPGETCVSGICMVPARPAPASPPADGGPAASPAPAAPPAASPPPPPAPVPQATDSEAAPVPKATDSETDQAAPLPAVVKGARPVPYVPAPRLPDRERTGALFLPFIGLHSFMDSNHSGLDAGLRVGTFLGGYLNNDWSLNGLAELDVLNPNGSLAAAGINASGQILAVSLNPLFHVGNVKGEFVAGPKLGGWVEWVHADGTDPTTGLSVSADGTVEGWTIGGDIGGFVAASPSVLVGALLSLELREPLHACETVTGQGEMCGLNATNMTVLGFTFGIMF
jgi:hypothetical protein